jgi:uncharacterized protein
MLSYSDIVTVIQESAVYRTENIVTRKLETILSENILKKKPIKVITGIRRSGKSFILKRLYKKLSSDIPKQNLLFINFENDRLSGKSDPKHCLYLFFDEIQNIPGWERFIRTVYDSEDDDIYITGSNSQLLSSEFSTVIGGRVLEYQLQPFTFNEFLDYHGYRQLDLFSINEKKIELGRMFEIYLESGGFCETFTLSNKQKDIYRQSLIEKIVLKDIINRYRIQKPDVMQNLFLYIAKNPGSIVSAAKLSTVMGIDDKTVSLFLSYLNNVFLLGRVDKYQWKTKNIFRSQKKYYLSDNLFTHLCLESRKLENFIYTYLIEKYGSSSVFFIRNEKGQEVDFVVTYGRHYYCYQICTELNYENEKREIRSLRNLMKYRSEEEVMEDRFCLLYMKDSRLVKNTQPRIEVKQIIEFVLTE